MIARVMVASADKGGGGACGRAQTVNPLEHPDSLHLQSAQGCNLEIITHLNARDVYNGKVSVFAAPAGASDERRDDGATLRSAGHQRRALPAFWATR